MAVYLIRRIKKEYPLTYVFQALRSRVTAYGMGYSNDMDASLYPEPYSFFK